MMSIPLASASLLSIAIIAFYIFFFFPLAFSSLTGVKWYIDVNIVCIFMTTSTLEHLVIYLLVVWICFCELHNHTLFCFSVELSSLSNCKSSLCIIVINPY